MMCIKLSGLGRGSVFVLAILAAHVFLFGTAHAEFLGPDFITITMDDGKGHSASHGIANPLAHLPPQAQVPGRVHEMLNERFELKHGDTVLGWIDSLGCDLDGDPMAGISFSLTAGGSEVTVTVSSSTVSFPALTNPGASAEAEVTLTDNNGDGVTISPTGDNDGLYLAIYNGDQEYASLLSNGSVKGGSVTYSEDTSGPIAGSVSSIQSVFSFTLSGCDGASGTGTFTVIVPDEPLIPEPGCLTTLFCGLIALLATRRRS